MLTFSGGSNDGKGSPRSSGALELFCILIWMLGTQVRSLCENSLSPVLWFALYWILSCVHVILPENIQRKVREEGGEREDERRAEGWQAEDLRLVLTLPCASCVTLDKPLTSLSLFFFFIYEIGNKNAYLLHSAVVRTTWCKGYKNSSEGSRVLQERSTIIVIIELCRQNSCSASVPSIKLNPGQSAGRADMVVGCVCVWVQAGWFWVVHYISLSNPLMA